MRLRMRLLGAACALGVCAAQPASAQSAEWTAAGADPRIRVVAYDDTRIISLTGHLGYQMLIEFDPAERIENVAIGDSLGWQVTPNRAATLLFVKPMTRGAATNMTVVTTRRRYAFQLAANEASGPADPAIVYAVRFRYPPEPAPPPAPPPPPPPPPPPVNAAYEISGSPEVAPVRVYDDGAMTYFQLPPGADAPAVFLLNPDGGEELTNGQFRDGQLVVDQVGRAFVLRSGRARAVVRRQNLQGAPQ